MEVKRCGILLQLLVQVLYPEQSDRPPLILLGISDPLQWIEISKTAFGLGVSVAVLPADDHESILGVIERDTHLKILINFDGLMDKRLFGRLAEGKLLSTKREYWIVGSSLTAFKETISRVAVFENAQIMFVKANTTSLRIYLIKNPAQRFGGRFSYHLEREYLIDGQGQLKLSLDSPWSKEDFDWTDVTLPVGIVSLHCENSSEVTDEFMTWYEEEVDGSRDASPRFGYSLFRAFQQNLGFNFTIVCAQYWSVTSHTGGAVGDLVADKVAVVVAPMLALESRRQLLEVVFPLVYFQSTFTFQTPKENDLTGLAFLKPFSWTLWITLVGAIIAVGVVMKKTIQMEVQISRDQSCVPSLSLTILSSLGAICQQGMSFALAWNASRILQVAFFFTGLVLYNYYTSLVVSELISFPKATKINSLKALGESNLELGAQNISYVHYYMKESDLSYIRDLYKKMVSRKKYFYSPEEGTAKARRPGFAFHCESRVTLREMMNTYDFFELCNYHEIPLIKDPIYIMATKHSPLTEFFKLQFMKTVELGIGSKKDKIFGEPVIACLSNALIEEVDIKYIAPILLLLLYTAVLSVIILGIEIAWDKWSNRYTKFLLE